MSDSILFFSECKVTYIYPYLQWGIPHKLWGKVLNCNILHQVASKHNNKKKLSRYHNAIARLTTNVLENY